MSDHSTEAPTTKPAGRIPVWLKLVYTAFVLILVPHYWNSYGPTNFLYFCDMAVFFALGAIWLEWPILASMPAVGILLPQALWMIDFLAELAGFRMTGMTGYMFDQSIPPFTRGLSLFHFWLPILLVWLVWRLGYDRRALPVWTVLAWALVLVCYLWMPAPPAPPDDPNRVVNINYVYGFSDTPQQWMPQKFYVAAEMAVLALGIFLPTHYLLAWLFPTRSGFPARPT
ncbi:MAG: hypothetical protein HY290_13935 [Planctomycetia bacterium]|nr:hypothetical protein [Planctomycetia bacterium]